MTYTMKRHTDNRLSMLSLGRMKTQVMMLLILVAGVGEMWAQTNYSGTYYLRNTQTNNQNYYLVPAVGGYYNNNEATPYLTTFKTAQDMNSLWRLEKVTIDGTDYYRIIHNSTGLYVTANGTVVGQSGNDAARLRIHLEAFNTPTDATLFLITEPSGGKVAIRPKDTSYFVDDKCWWDMGNGNKDNYWNDNWEGALGLWNGLSSPAYNWILESAPSTCAMPVITYDESAGSISLSYPIAGDGGVTIYYTTDGSKPTSSSSTYSAAFSATGVTMVRAIAVKTGYDNSAEAKLYSPTQLWLFKTTDDANVSYYMIPPTDDDRTSDLNVTTSNVPNERMQWYLKPAALRTGVQYYYFVNAVTGKYAYCNVNVDKPNALLMKALGEDDTESDRYMFRIIDYGTYLNIVPKHVARLIPSSSNKNCLRKANATDHTNPIGLYQDDGGLSRWTAIVLPDDPKSLFPQPSDMVSSSTNSVYFKLRGATQTDNADYFLTPPTTVQGAATAALDGDNQEWCLLPADDDDTWCTYYYLRNGSTGRYLYFDGTIYKTDGTTYNDNSNKFFASNEVVTGNEDKYKFLVLKTANTTYSGTYHIVPKSIRNNNNQASIALNRDKSSLRTQNSRGNNNSCWYLDAVSGYVAAPIITYHAADNTIDITCTTAGVTIYYTIDGTEPTTESTLYNSTFDLPDDVSTINAIAVKDGVSSKVATYTAIVHASVGVTKRIYYIQSVASTDFYLIPGDTNNGNVRVNTLSLPRPSMQWYFMDAGIENDIQYYYIVNNHADNDESASTLGYLYRNGNDANIKYTLDTSDDNYKFAIETNASGGYNIVAKNLPNNSLQKNDGNHNNATGIIVTNGAKTNAHARWNFVTTQPQQTAPMTVSSETATYMYTIGNVGQTGYITLPTSTKVTLASDAGDDQTWYFLEAQSDDWVTYYYIVHANTGKYLYFDGTTTSQKDEESLILKEKSSDNEDQYQFAFANTVTEGQYYIIPKVHKYAYNHQYYLLYKSNNAMTLKTNAGRSDNRFKWTFSQYDFKCSTPQFSYMSGTMTISCSTPGSTIYYAIGGNAPTISEACKYTGPFTLDGTTTVKAFAILGNDDTYMSDVAEFTLNSISSGDEITNMSGYYYLAENFTPSSEPIGTSIAPFRGTIDGQLYPFSISHPFVGYAENATIKNVILDNVSITSGSDDGNVGAVCCEATGATRIYNCGVLATNSTVTTDDDGYTHISSNSSTVSGSNYVGGIVGFIDGSARVINCFSYANITGGTNVGGIVGYNDYASTSSDIKTMVMNCMFYGDITGGSNKAPIYNGKIITNRGDQNGVGNYNYFWGGASYVQNRQIDTYNCALMAETRFLQRFEFFRHLLNSHRELAAWWATGSMANKDQMMKWVLEPSQIGSTTPYPILKTPGYYPSVVNIDAKNATTQSERNKGGLLGTLSVTIQMGSGAVFGAPTGASITTSSLSLNITDKDPKHFNFNYAKVQLPYYNDVGSGNYTGYRVVTGWKIVSITGGSPGTFISTGTDATTDAEGKITAAPYNFADRNCTNKDLSSVSGRVFNQGAYWDVPEGVTAITIEPYWAKAAYLADANADVVYNQAMSTSYNVPNVGGGTIYKNKTKFSIAGEEQTVYTSLGDAVTGLSVNTSHTVNDYAVVLVGNYHHYVGNNGAVSGNSPYTVTSADFDHDNEPDYSLMLRNDGRNQWHPVKWDFINIPGLGMAQKSTGGTGTYNFGIMQPIGWFESTNTSLFRVTQFEYDRSERGEAPLILQGGVMEQWVNGQNNGAANKTTYFHVGGNVWFKEFHRGTHIDKTLTSTHPPLSVTGGDYDEFYLTGLYKAVTKTNDNAECYINGGRFGIVAGTGMEGIGDDNNNAQTKGNIIWQIQNADIDEFYGGGINAASCIGGNITTVITGSRVRQFCGGPKFGDLYSGKTVITTATDCEFGTYFGAGYGGNSYSTFPPSNKTGIPGDYGEDNWNTFVTDNYTQEYKVNNSPAYKGVSTEFYYQYLPQSNNTENVARIFVNFVIFSLATTHNVTSTLNDCTVKKNFYGGGSLGKVDGPVTSTLNNCTVEGNVFGAGYSASLPTVEVMKTGGFVKAPYYDSNLGAYFEPTYPETVTYEWEHAETVNETDNAIDKTDDHILYTTEDLSHTNLGSVSGAVTLTITGTSVIGTDGDTTTGNVYGGGDQSTVNNTTTPTDASTTVTISGNTEVLGNVFGGGNQGLVSGSATVNIQE